MSPSYKELQTDNLAKISQLEIKVVPSLVDAVFIEGILGVYPLDEILMTQSTILEDISLLELVWVPFEF